jgi:signal transduction histidine kinase/ActR/RegA family two-component response regulator
MNIIKQNSKIYNDLKSLLRLSIAGIFIVAGLNYLFNELIENLELNTKNKQLEIDILKKAKADTLQARYHTSKLSYRSSENIYTNHKLNALESIKDSDDEIKILKYGGDIKLSFYGKTKFYDANKNKNKLPIITESDLRPLLLAYIKKVDNLRKSDLDLLKRYKLIEDLVNDAIKSINSRLENIDRTLNLSQNSLILIENDIKYKKLLYFYTQIFTYIFIIFSLVFISKPIRSHIIETNEELENRSLEAKKLAVRAKQASKSKSEFLANMSHEIRTPLNAILGFIDLLREKESDPEKLQYIKTVHSSSVTLLGIINDILDFSKIESGNLEIEKIDFNVDDEFKTLVDLFRSKASEKSISLILNMDQNMPSALHSDPLRIKQIIANLISNAIKFTPRNGKVVLNIRYENEKLFVSVNDTGIGIPKDKQKDIFKAFSQAESSTTRKFGGTGLGLTISSRLVSLLGGTLKVESTEGKGSTFSFNIPVKVGKYKRENTIQEVDLSSIKGKKILLVEDNKPNQMFMSLILKKFGLTYKIANDGLEAIKEFEHDKFDLIFMDENMPNLNGIEATKTILNIEKKRGLEHTPIIALTANALKGDREKFLNSGMDEYITKPVSKDKIAHIFEQFLIQKESQC